MKKPLPCTTSTKDRPMTRANMSKDDMVSPDGIADVKITGQTSTVRSEPIARTNRRRRSARSPTRQTKGAYTQANQQKAPGGRLLSDAIHYTSWCGLLIAKRAASGSPTTCQPNNYYHLMCVLLERSRSPRNSPSHS